MLAFVIIAAAFASPEAFWVFVTAPDTPHAERMHAVEAARLPPLESRAHDAIVADGRDADEAMRAAPRYILPPDYLARIEELARVLEAEAALHRWGLGPQPVPPGASNVRLEAPPFTGERVRSIRGYEWVVPEKRVAYPVTPEEMARAPWPWQVQQVLEPLRRGILAGPPNEVWPAITKLPCGSERDARPYIELSFQYGMFVRKITPEIAGAWRNIGVRDDLRDVRGQLAYVLDVIGLSVAPDAFWLGEALMADLIEQARDEDLNGLAFQLPELMKGRLANDKTVQRPAVPAVAIELLARRIDSMDPGSRSISGGYAAFHFLKAATNEDVATPRSSGDDYRAYDAMVVRYRTWYKAHRDELAAAAAKHEPLLAPHRARLRKVTTCAASSAR
jgi:hypothetical protein